MDVLQEMHSNAIEPRANRLFFMLNENTNVSTGCDQTSTRRLGTSSIREWRSRKSQCLKTSCKLARLFENDTNFGIWIQKQYILYDSFWISVDLLMIQAKLNQEKSMYILKGTLE